MKNLLIVFWSLVISVHLISQDVPLVTNKIFIKNIMLHTKPDAAPYVGNILIEDGIISNIGTSISPPFDARIVPGDSLYAYPGFIATLSHIGVKEPKENEQRPKVDNPGYPPNDIAGITPEKSIDQIYDATDGSIDDYRKLGFAIAHTVPHGRMMPGKGSVISLSGLPFNEVTLSKDYSMFAQWISAQGVFPGTLIGIMAKWREMYRNAELAITHTKKYNDNPLNRIRPDQDPATEALFPVVSKQIPVFFSAEKHRDIHRTLMLKKDLGFKLVLGEVRDVDRIINQVQESGASILLSLELPDEEKEEKEKKKEKDEKEEEKTDTDEKMEQMKKRKKEASDRYVGQAKILSEKKIPVVFSYLNAKPKDIYPNLRRLIKSGLSESEVLSALTTSPATTLGLSNVAGTLENGKIGNLVISTGPIFDEKSNIKMVIVDGKLHTYDVKEKKKKSSDDVVIDVSGTWSYKIEVPGMTPSGTMTFTKNGENYDLEVTSSQNPGESVNTSDIELEGNNMVFNYSMSAGGMNISIDNDITFDGNSFEGTVSVADFGSFEITGTKSDPE